MRALVFCSRSAGNLAAQHGRHVNALCHTMPRCFVAACPCRGASYEPVKKLPSFFLRLLTARGGMVNDCTVRGGPKSSRTHRDQLCSLVAVRGQVRREELLGLRPAWFCLRRLTIRLLPRTECR